MTEPQVWVLIGVFAASMFGMLRMTHRTFADLLRAEIGGLRGEMNAKFEAQDVKFDQLNAKVDRLDRDVQVLFRRVFPEYPEAG